LFGRLAFADVVTADPSSFAPGTLLDNAFPGINLSVWVTDLTVSGGVVQSVTVVSPPSEQFDVYSGNPNDGEFAGPAWTGYSDSMRIFIASGASFFQESFAGQPAFIQARAADGSVIATVSGGTAGSPGFVLSISSPQVPISYLYVSSATHADTTLEQFEYSPVPLPATGWLLLSGLGWLVALSGRRRNKD